MSSHHYRYERKFIVPGRERQWTEAVITLHPAGFAPIYQPRQVNNLYFDSPGHDNYLDNVNGARYREKVRIRWYGELFDPVTSPNLEFKRKDGHLGQKHIYPLAPVSLSSDFSIDTVRRCLADSALPEPVVVRMNGLSLSLVNSYRRKYFLTRDGRYRLTLDYDLRYLAIADRHNSFARYPDHGLHTVVELKYAVEDDGQVQRITNLFPFRLAKNSKYIDGIDWVS